MDVRKMSDKGYNMIEGDCMVGAVRRINCVSWYLEGVFN